ncbi:MAG: hypothetical protein HY675_01040 [Chloroflexi bacterium]|nr:hypothetical protein [Chloroflexota bacterium]
MRKSLMYDWLLLIYTIPADPPGSRAYVWRELKKLGGIYLRDGVYLLPDRDDLAIQAEALSARIEDVRGESTLIRGVHLPPEKEVAAVARFGENRGKEYDEVARECRQLLEHIRREAQHYEFGFRQVEEIQEDLAKIRCWLQQVEVRDYFGAPRQDGIDALLKDCENALGQFVQEGAWQDQTTDGTI